MRKKNWALYLMLGIATPNIAQDFSGLRMGNYTGVNGVFINPANIADNRYKWHTNLFGLSAYAGNNQTSYKLQDLSNSFNSDTLRNKIFGKDAGPSSGMISTAVAGPSAMFRVGKKGAMAFTSRARVMANVVDIDGKLLGKITEDFKNDPSLPYTIASNGNMKLSMNAWTEFGASYARELYNEGKHFIKSGITVKYLSGAANAYVNVNGFKGTLNADMIGQYAYLQNTTGKLSLGFGGVNIDDFSGSDLTAFVSAGVGADIGFVYEYRPANDEHKNHNNYKLRAGISLLDIGSIKYQKDMRRSGDYDISITGNERFNVTAFDSVNLDDYKRFFDSRPQYFTPASTNNTTSYSVSMPSTLQFDVDYHVAKGLYVSAAGQLNLNGNADALYNSQYYNSFTLSPRFETKSFGVYLPVAYNSLTKINAGISLRFGPLFIGSGSVIGALLDESKQADIHVGFSFGSLIKK